MKKSVGKRITVLTTAACLSVAASGCLFNRVVEVREQLCEFDTNFAVDLSSATTVDMHNPVLLDSDILWLAGAQPTEVTESADGLSMLFIIEKVSAQPEPEQDLWVAMEFERSGDDQKLTQVRIDPKLRAMIGPENLDQSTIRSAAETVCEGGHGFLAKTVELEITDEEMEMLPSRAEVLEWIGAPLEEDENTRRMTYEYRLKNDEPEPRKARFSVWYDEAGIMPLRLVSQYSRFRTEADFETRKMIMKVDI